MGMRRKVGFWHWGGSLWLEHRVGGDKGQKMCRRIKQGSVGLVDQ